MSDYVYQEPVNPALDLLPEGDYEYTVTGLISQPYTTNAGNYVLPLKLAVGPGKLTMWAYPSVGESKQGNPYDSIAPFLKSCGKNPKPGQRADLSENNLKGARGMCHVKVEIAEAGQMKGKEVNKVHYFIWDNAAGTPKSQQMPVPVTGAGPRVSDEPDDIPF
jgi:hypothetical protein